MRATFDVKFNTAEYQRITDLLVAFAKSEYSFDFNSFEICALCDSIQFSIKILFCSVFGLDEKCCGFFDCNSCNHLVCGFKCCLWASIWISLWCASSITAHCLYIAQLSWIICIAVCIHIACL